MLSNKKEDYEYQAWNIAEAQVAIAAIKELSDLTNEQQEFLNGILQTLITYNNKVKESLSPKISTDPADYNSQKTINTYLQETISATSQLELMMNDLIIDLQKEYKLAHSKVKVPVNSKYLNFLNNLIDCCLGVLKKIVTIKIDMKDIEQQLKFMASELDKSGVIFFPFSQSLDPLAGTAMTEKAKMNVGSKHSEDKGKCAGRTFVWANQIIKNGQSDLKFILDPDSHQYHKTQTEHLDVFKCTHDNEVVNYAAIKTFIPPINDLNIYYLSLNGKSDGHSVGIRRIPDTNEIEFFDSNFGLLVCKNESSFIHAFALLLQFYRLSFLDIQTMNMYSIGEQPPSAKPSLPIFDLPLKYTLPITGLEKLINFYNRKLEAIKNNPFNAPMDAQRLCQIFTDAFPVYVSFATDTQQLELIRKQLLTLDFLKKENGPTGFKLLPLINWQDKAIKELNTIINSRVEQLRQIKAPTLK